MVTEGLKEHTASIFFNPKDGGDVFLQNIGNHLQHCTAPQLRRPQSSFSTWWKPQISNKYHCFSAVQYEIIFVLDFTSLLNLISNKMVSTSETIYLITGCLFTKWWTYIYCTTKYCNIRNLSSTLVPSQPHYFKCRDKSLTMTLVKVLSSSPLPWFITPPFPTTMKPHCFMLMWHHYFHCIFSVLRLAYYYKPHIINDLADISVLFLLYLLNIPVSVSYYVTSPKLLTDLVATVLQSV